MNKLLSSLAVLLLTMGACGTCFGQNPFQPSFNQTVQLPVVRFFNVRTVVSAPDGGAMSLGGVSRFSSGARSRGIPLLPGRPFTNRASGFEAGGSHMVVKPTIIISGELEADVLAEANRREAFRVSTDPNGTKDVQAKADFISRNIGRRKR